MDEREEHMEMNGAKVSPIIVDYAHGITTRMFIIEHHC